MSELDRRQLLRGILGTFLAQAGSVLLASGTVPASQTQASEPEAEPPTDPQQRAGKPMPRCSRRSQPSRRPPAP